MIQKATTFLREVRSELSQVSWPTPLELWESTKVVLVAMILLSAVIGLMDLICSNFIRWVVR